MEGKTIKQKLDFLGVSQKWLADALGVTPQSVSAILAAKDVRSGTLERIAEVLHQPMTFFYPVIEESLVVVNAPQKAHNLNNGSGTINEGKEKGNDEAMRMLLEQNQKLISMLASQMKGGAQ